MVWPRHGRYKYLWGEKNGTVTVYNLSHMIQVEEGRDEFVPCDWRDGNVLHYLSNMLSAN